MTKSKKLSSAYHSIITNHSMIANRIEYLIIFNSLNLTSQSQAAKLNFVYIFILLGICSLLIEDGSYHQLLPKKSGDRSSDINRQIHLPCKYMHFLKVNAFEGCMSRIEGTLIINCSYLILITEQYWVYQHSSIKTSVITTIFVRLFKNSYSCWNWIVWNFAILRKIYDLIKDVSFFWTTILSTIYFMSVYRSQILA